MRNVKTTHGNARGHVNRSPHRTTDGVFVRGLPDGRDENESRSKAKAITALFICCDIEIIVFQKNKKSYLPNGEERFKARGLIVDAHETVLQGETHNTPHLENAKNQLDKYLAPAAFDRDIKPPLAIWLTDNCSSSRG